jgi:copper oxidase (laccase) domain-containing protein
MENLVDLRRLNRSVLEQAGVPQNQIHQVGPCELREDDFFSYRRERAGTGRQISFIGWLP